MKLNGLLVLCFFVFFCAGVETQSALLEKGENGIGGEVRSSWTSDGFKGVEIGTGYSIAGIIDIGADLDFTLGELEGADSTEVRVAFDYNVNVFKQTSRVPLSLQVMGSYGLVNVSSDYLDNNNLIRRGTGYTIGTSLSRTFRFTSFWLVRMNVLIDYESFTYNDRDVGAPTIINNQEHVGNLSFGGGLGFLFRFPRGSTLAVHAELRADQDLQLQIQPILALAFPQKS